MLCKLQDVEFNVVSEELPSYENEVTNRPVENLGSIVDNVDNKPLIFQINGLVTGVDAFQKIKQLRKYVADKQILRYVGRNVIANVVIEKLATTHNNRNATGFGFDITLKQIRVATIETVQIKAPDPAIPRIPPASTQTKKLSNKGVQPTPTKTVDLQSLRTQAQDRAKKPADVTLRQQINPRVFGNIKPF